VSHFAQAERGALCDLLLAVGPGGPTLCEGWTTGDLAAHLVVRERRPDAAAGVVVPGLGRYTERVQRRVRDGEPWESLVGRVRAGPPAAMRPIDEAVNLVEYFVHHEDVRRASAGWEPRSIDAAEEASLWGRVRQMGRLLGRHSPIGLAVNAPGYGQATVKGGTPAVTVLGAPGELVLLLFGRGAQARVTFEGDEVSIGRLRHTSFGL
jgi:uncharacterized protein (TIGR03085 family)